MNIAISMPFDGVIAQRRRRRAHSRFGDIVLRRRRLLGKSCPSGRRK
ncbi:MAG: hypothetical protein R3C54_02185 [Parvularculaceae bacterium]